VVSPVYAWHQSLTLLALLGHRGLVRDGRDTTTGRKVATIIRDLARVAPADRLDDYDTELTEALIAAYKRLRTLPLTEVHRICRDADDAH
jgi:hypothetical protein